ncbi:MAG: TrmH family RNA methyltransferase [Bacillota bacterium]
MAKLISSSNNQTVKNIRALRQRKQRQQSGAYFIEGIRIVGEAIQLGQRLETLVVAPDLLTSEFARDLVQQQRSRGVPCLEVTASVFRSLSSKDGPQGLAAVVRQHWTELAAVWPIPGDLWVALEEVQDPGNLGTIMRTADAVGCRGVILVGNCTDPFDPGTVRASMGSLFNLQLVQTSPSKLLAWKQERGVALIGTAGGAMQHYRDVTYPSPLVLISGSERQGLSTELLQGCDQLVKIPMVGRADSLNLAVATCVVLYEIFHQLPLSGVPGR